MKKSDLYKSIRDIAKAGITDLEFVDLQKGQFKRIKENQPVPLPALLIEFRGGSFSEMARNSQMGDVTIAIYFYLDLVTDSFDGAESEEETIELLDRQDDVYRVFQGQSCELFSKLIRTNEEPPQYGERYIMFRTDFSTNVKEILEPVLATIQKPIIKLKMI
jgi:hypothetical protein